MSTPIPSDALPEHEVIAPLLAQAWSLLGMDDQPDPPVSPADIELHVPAIIDQILPVFAALPVNAVYWDNYSFNNRGDSAAFLELCRRACAEMRIPADWRDTTLLRLATILATKLYRDWNTLVEVIQLAATYPFQAPSLLVGVFINLLLLKRNLNPRLASDKSDLEYTAARLRRALTKLLDHLLLDEPGYGLVVPIFRLLPQIGNEDQIGTIRALSERFDEDRPDQGDPWRTRANSLRKSIHQKPSEQNIAMVEAYLAEQDAIAGGRAPGPADSAEMVELARDLLEELRRFWSVVTDAGQIEAGFNALRERWPELGTHAGSQVDVHYGHFLAASRAGAFHDSNEALTSLRKSLKQACQASSNGQLRLEIIGFEVSAEHLSFAYQGSLCNQYYQSFTLADTPQAIGLLGQIIRSVRCSGGGDKQLGRTGMLLEQENRQHGADTAVLRGIIKDVLNQTKMATDRMKTLTEEAIIAMLREWQPDLGPFDCDRHLIALYNSFFRSSSFLHVGEFAAFLSAALLPYGEVRSRLGDESQHDARLVWRFHGKPDGDIPAEGQLRYQVGGKAAGLLSMWSRGLPVPEGFCLGTKIHQLGPETPEADDAVAGQPALDPDLWRVVMDELRALETATGRQFGDTERPLLVSVRSGAPVSMPGMMDTILNIGLSHDVLRSRSAADADRAFWHDCRLHLIWLFASSVHAGLSMPRLATVIKAWYLHRGEIKRRDWSENILKHALELYKDYTGSDFPEDPYLQLRLAITAVLRSWNSLRAREYRAINHIPDHLGTGVTIQRMVFGNRDAQSASGVFFSRDPETGRADFGEMVIRGQGEEVVSGQHSARPVQDLAGLAPGAWKNLLDITHRLEASHRVPQDIEFTVESGRLWILQARSARLTTRGRLLALIDMVDEGLISPEDALGELNAEALSDLDSTTFSQRDIELAELKGMVLAHGLGVFHGVATGKAAFSLDGIRRLRRDMPDTRCILIKEDTKPEDIEAMYESVACATRVGGPTSHAAINARVIGRPCVVNCSTLTIVKDAFDTITEIRVGNQVVHEGDPVSLDGNRALFIQGELRVQAPESDAQSRGARQRFLAWHRLREARHASEPD